MQQKKEQSSAGVGDHWQEIARKWQHVGPPLRPTMEDTRIVWKAVQSWHGPRPPSVLILGVTSELYHLPWQAGSDIAAVDKSQAMIDFLWPGPSDRAFCGDWTNLPAPLQTRDIVLCDGGLSVLAFPNEHRGLCSQLLRVLAPGGLCIFRLYILPTDRPSPSKVFEDLAAGRIANLSELKFKLWTAMAKGPYGRVQLQDIWNAYNHAVPHPEVLARSIDWDEAHLQAIDSYRGCLDYYYFPSVQQILDLYGGSSKGLTFESVENPKYVLGEQCPTLVLRRA